MKIIFQYKKIIYFIIFMSVQGCSVQLSEYQIQKIFQTINISDGIQKKEALIISQNFLIDKGIVIKLFQYIRII